MTDDNNVHNRVNTLNGVICYLLRMNVIEYTNTAVYQECR